MDCFSIHNDMAEKEALRTVPFRKKLKYLGINLSKDVTDLYNEN